MISSYEIFGKFPRINRKFSPAYNKKRRRSYIRTTKEWKTKYTEMVIQVEEQAVVTIKDKVDAVIYLTINDDEDSDAPIKGILDALEEGGAIENDNLIRNLFILREKQDGDGDHAHIEFHNHQDMNVLMGGADAGLG